MKWTEAQLSPAQRRPRGLVQELVEELSAQPGRWAEVARYPADRRVSAYTRGSMAAKRFASHRLEYAVTRDGDHYLLHYRVAP